MYLIIEDDPQCGLGISRLARRYGTTKLAPSYDTAKRLLLDVAPRAWTAIVVDVTLMDGNGLEALRDARDRGVDAPAAVYSGRCEPEFVNRATELRSRYIVKPHVDLLRAFLAEAASCVAPAAGTAVAQFVRQYALSPQQHEILLAIVTGEDDHALCKRLDVTASTLESHRKKLRERTRLGMKEIDALLKQRLNRT
jgi:DNA-binding NarL/FixJ family response regulator